MYQTVELVIKAPLGWKCLTKEGLRDTRVQVLGAHFGDTRWFCGCEAPPPKSKKLPTDRRLWPANKRWTKNNVPGEADPRMKNPAPIDKGEEPFDPWQDA